MRSKIVFLWTSMILVTTALSANAQSGKRHANIPIGNETGITREICDVRDSRDYAEGDNEISGTLRHRIDLFNSQLNEQEETTGEGRCLYGIYFLDPMTITLQSPLKIRNSPNPLNDGVTVAATHISGRHDDSEEPLGIEIDAREITKTPGQCAFMIEDGLAPFVQIHDLKILVSDSRRAICDFAGNDLRGETIPDNGFRACETDAEALNCDFRGVDIESPDGVVEANDLDEDGVEDDIDACLDTPADSAVNTEGCPDSDGDDVFDDVDDCDDQKGSYLLRGCPILFVLKPILPPRVLCILQNDCGPVVVPGDDGDVDGIDNDKDLCPEEAGIVINGGCPNTMCISFADGLPKVKENVDEDDDNIDKACDVNDTPRGNPPPPPPSEPPTCSLTATADGENFDLVWETENATTVTLTDGTNTAAGVISEELSGTKEDVSITNTIIFSLTATGPGGVCGRGITLTQGTPVPTAPTCDLVSATLDDGYDLTWTSSNAESAALTEEGNTTQLSTELNSTSAIHVTPNTKKIYQLAVLGVGGFCVESLSLDPVTTGSEVPTCDLVATDADTGFNLTWTSANGTAAVLLGGTETLSSDLNSTAPLNVNPTASTVYSLTITGEEGSCSDSITLASGTVLDRDGDDILDIGDNCPDTNSQDLTDTNNDGEGNPCDVDDDGDGDNDDVDNCDLISNPEQQDDDGDGIGNACEGSTGGSTPPANDQDGDGIPDNLEDQFGTLVDNADTDGDGLSDGEEVMSSYYPSCGPTDPDCDDDGVCDGEGTVTDDAGNAICQPVTEGKGDNCPLVSNGTNTEGLSADQIQADADGNDVGDACEGDRDGDEVSDDVDNCALIPNKEQDDADNNGFGDACDPGFSVSPASGGGCGCRIGGDQPKGDSGWAIMGLMGLPLILFRRMRRDQKCK